MEKVEIRSIDNHYYEAFLKLYSISFPIFEQRTRVQQEYAFEQQNYHLVGYVEDSLLVGFISYWEFDYYIYIEHFAIDEKNRGKGYGSKLLNLFIESTCKVVLLEIDPIIDEVSKARLRFYSRCGFYQNTYLHTHPSYRDEYKPHSLIVLTTSRPINEKEYSIFYSDLCEIVMNK